MGDLGYGPIVNGIDTEAVQRMSWFDNLSAGKQHTDFFANRVTNYSKGVQNWDAAALLEYGKQRTTSRLYKLGSWKTVP